MFTKMCAESYKFMKIKRWVFLFLREKAFRMHFVVGYPIFYSNFYEWKLKHRKIGEPNSEWGKSRNSLSFDKNKILWLKFPCHVKWFFNSSRREFLAILHCNCWVQGSNFHSETSWIFISLDFSISYFFVFMDKK